MPSSRLIRPRADLRASHESLVSEFQDQEEELVPWVLAEPTEDFQGYVDILNRWSQGLDLREGFVPNSTFWLVDDQEEIVAVSSLRHELTDFLLTFGGHIGFGVRPSARRNGYATKILGQTLLEAKKLAIRKVLVTCDKANTGSVKAITKNGGVLDAEEYMEEHACVVQRYWIRN